MRATTLSTVFTLIAALQYPDYLRAQPSPEGLAECTEMARVIVAPATEFWNQNDRDALNYHLACGQNSSANSTAVQVMYAGVGLGVSNSNQNSQQHCDTLKKTVNTSSSTYFKTVAFFSASLPTINSCIEAVNAGWALKADRIGADTVGLTLSHRGAGGGMLNAIDLLPKNGSLQCDGIPAGLSEQAPLQISNVKSISLLCTRTPERTEFEDNVYQIAKEATIYFRLADRPLSITLPAYNNSPVNQLGGRVEKLQENMQDLESRITEATNSINDINSLMSYGKVSGTSIVSGSNIPKYCGKNQVVIGAYFRDQTSTLTIYCGPLIGARK